MTKPFINSLRDVFAHVVKHLRSNSPHNNAFDAFAQYLMDKDSISLSQAETKIKNMIDTAFGERMDNGYRPKPIDETLCDILKEHDDMKDKPEVLALKRSITDKFSALNMQLLARRSEV